MICLPSAPRAAAALARWTRRSTGVDRRGIGALAHLSMMVALGRYDEARRQEVELGAAIHPFARYLNLTDGCFAARARREASDRAGTGVAECHSPKASLAAR